MGLQGNDPLITGEPGMRLRSDDLEEHLRKESGPVE